ncbi:hypothetical protein [Mesorhizobium sp. ANAO-SY3R2]
MFEKETIKQGERSGAVSLSASYPFVRSVRAAKFACMVKIRGSA